MYNEITLVGTALNDPTTWNLKNGASVSRFFLATSEQYKNKHGEWQQRDQVHNCAGWHIMSTSVQNKVKKKTLLLVRGKLIYSKAEKDGVTYDRPEIEISYIRPIQRADSVQQSERPQQTNKRATRRADAPQTEKKPYKRRKTRIANVDLDTGEILDAAADIFNTKEPVKAKYDTSDDIDGCEDMPF